MPCTVQGRADRELTVHHLCARYARVIWGVMGKRYLLIFLLGFAINSHQVGMVGIDQPQTREWLKLSDAVRVDWHLYPDALNDRER